MCSVNPSESSCRANASEKMAATAANSSMTSDGIVAASTFLPPAFFLPPAMVAARPVVSCDSTEYVALNKPSCV